MKARLQNREKDSSNLIVLLFIVGYLLMDFLPSFKTIDRYSPQYVYLALVNIVIGIYCYCNPKIVPQRLISIYRGSSVLKTYVTFLFLCGVSIISAINASLAVVAFSKLLIIFCVFLNLTILLYNRFELLFKIAFIVGISILIQSILILYDFSKTLDLSGIKGNSGNINILAASLNIKIPFLILGIIHFSNWKRAMLILALLLSVIIIFLTGSRATFLGLGLQLIVFLVFYCKINTIKKAEFIKMACIIFPVIISFVISNLIFAKVGDSERYKSVGSRIGQIELTNNPTDSSAKLRLDFWKNAGEIIAENPLLGVGIGNWKIKSLSYENTLIDDSNISSNAHNDFLEITAETGIVNGLVYLSLFVIIVWISVKKILQSKEKEVQLTAIFSLMLLSGYGLDALLNFPLYIPAVQLGFCFLSALTLVNGREEVVVSEPERSVSGIKIVPVAITIISLVCLYFAFSQFKAAQLEYKFKVYQAAYRVNDMLPETGRLLESNDIIANLPTYPSLSFYSEPFVEYAGVSLFYEKKYKEALHYFELAQKLNPYLGNSDWYIQKIAFNNGDIDKAYKYAKIAFYKRPRNKDFYLSALFVANEKKDTLEMLKIHNQFSKYRKMPENWVSTSKALQLSGFSHQKLLSFLDEGLAAFPKDSLLLERKSDVLHVLRDNYLLKAQEYGKEQKFDMAITYYQKALNEDPKNELVIQNIGICYFKLDQYKKAIDYLSKISNAASLNDGKTEYVLGTCYIAIQDKTKGCKYLGISKNKNFPGAEQLLERFCK
jgi:O-antigen ligase/tetratricopeptide (TPR) repeat protein